MIRRANGETAAIPIIRDRYTVPAAEGHLMDNGRIGYVRVYRFGTDATRELDKVLRTFDFESLEGLILDLRDNPGGRGLEAMSVASHFIDYGFVLITQIPARAQRKHYSFGNALPNLPLAVLINRHAASASEVAAGAIRDHGMGILIGESSFGKGVYQRLFEFPDGAALKLTTGEWFTPDGYSVHGVGLTPDIVVEEGEDAIEVAIE